MKPNNFSQTKALWPLLALCHACGFGQSVEELTRGSDVGGSGTNGAAENESGAGGANGGSSASRSTNAEQLSLEGLQQTAVPGSAGLYEDYWMCPKDQLVIGFSGTIEGSALRSVQTVCGIPALAASGNGYDIAITSGVTLPSLGRYPGTGRWDRNCPANEVIVGFSGRSDALLESLAFSCAKLEVVVAESGRPLITFGEPAQLPAIGGERGVDFPEISCPAGYIARGNTVFSSNIEQRDVRAFSLYCARPVFAVALGSSCETASDCQTGVCDDGVCQASACTPSDTCVCDLYLQRDYRFCKQEIDRTAARADCAHEGMRLTRIDNAAEGAWIHSTATLYGLRETQIGAVQVGEQLGEASVWQWEDGTIFWENATAQNNLFTRWATWEPSPHDPGDCGAMFWSSEWWATPCTALKPYTCERY